MNGRVCGRVWQGAHSTAGKRLAAHLLRFLFHFPLHLLGPTPVTAPAPDPDPDPLPLAPAQEGKRIMLVTCRSTPALALLSLPSTLSVLQQQCSPSRSTHTNSTRNTPALPCGHTQKLYDRSLEQRILLQKVLQGSLRLPLGPLPPPLAPSGDDDGDGAASPSASGEEVEEQLRPLGRAYDELRRSAGATLVEMLRLQRALLLRSEVSKMCGRGCVGMCGDAHMGLGTRCQSDAQQWPWRNG